MTLFVASWGANDQLRARARDVLRDYAGCFPELAECGVRETGWTGPVHVAWLHGAGPVTGERAGADRVTLVDGVAIRGFGDAVVTAEAVAARPFGELAGDSELDGQFALLDAMPDRLGIATDTLGMYTLHWCRTADGWLVSNRVEPLARLVGADAIDADAAAAFVAVGWVTGERTLADGVRTVPGGAHWYWTPDREPVFSRPRDPWRIVTAPRTRVDMSALRDALVARCAAVGDWAGSVESGLTSGLDSRLLFMLLRAAQVKTIYITAGHPQSPDVLVSQRIAETYGVDRRHIPPFSEEEVRDQWQTLARQLVVQNDGMVSLWQNIDLMRPPVAAPVSFWGVGGNIGRSFYGTPRDLATVRTAAQLARFKAARTANGHGLVTADGLAASRRQVDEFVNTAIAQGTSPADVPDAFSALELIGRWSAPNTRKIYPTPVFGPLSTRPYLRATFAFSPVRRYSEPLHYHLFRMLAPGEEIANHPSGKWRPQIPYLNLLFGRARQRVMQNAGRDPLGIRYRILELLRAELAARCLDRTSSPLWQVISRPAFEAAMSGTSEADAERRTTLAKPILAVLTLFEYEAMRSEGRA
ncbi:hypothetical protein [Saccharopolyspora thermophila]|uniref:hypothetical protein n=1 Tax=Saccharopolyspora thermophila TaxID=89367 RepID=UPI00166AB28A|nr:hypothetical protein [Saccharopolyspora subtropica]